jgi:predicted alpha-1,2-mannosidase
MRMHFGWTSVFVFVLLSSCESVDNTKYVDPNIGGVATLLTTKKPTVHRPHSMIRVFPVTKPGLEDRYLSDKIYGFAVNMPAYRMGHVTELMPTLGEISLDREMNASLYDHDQEEVHPWYHSVMLEDKEILADWTTTERAVIYRFNFPASGKANIIFSSNGNACFTSATKKSIQGWEEFRNAKQYFFAEFSVIPSAVGYFNEGKPVETITEIRGKKCGSYATFPSGKIIEVRIGISYIDEQQAKVNLHKEMNNKSFGEISTQSHQIWKDALDKIQVSGGTERQLRIFYTSFYRAMERMVNISEYGRYYSGYDQKVHPDEGKPFYVDDWLWDTFRCLHPLGTLLDPDQQAEMVNSYVKMYDQSGWMPTFPQFYGDFPAMIGFHTAPVVWDNYQKGNRNFDVQKAYEGLRKNAMEGTMVPWRNGPSCSLDTFYRANGWFPALPKDSAETVKLVDGFESRQSVALSLEHSYDDWCLAQLAQALGKVSDYKYFMQTSQNYRKVWNEKTGFMSPKMANGKWVEPFDPQLSGGYGSRAYFAENNAWIWNFSVMHDIPGLVGLMGGNERFSERFDELFNEPTEIAKWQFMGQFPDASGLNGMFPAGNEPSFHVPYLYNYAGKPWKTQRRVRELMDMWFDDKPLGIPGDEDGGALCSWYMFNAMGFYPVTTGTGLYAIGSPLFKKVVIKLKDGKLFTIKANNCSKKNKYIQSARLNGLPFNRCWIKHSEIVDGGVLEMEMAEKPNKQWASDPGVYDKLLKETLN